MGRSVLNRSDRRGDFGKGLRDIVIGNLLFSVVLRGLGEEIVPDENRDSRLNHLARPQFDVSGSLFTRERERVSQFRVSGNKL